MENKNKIKTFGKVLYVLAIIARVCMYIGMVCLALLLIVIPVLFSKVDIQKNRVAIVGIPDAKVEMYKNPQDKLNIIVNDQEVDLSKEMNVTEQLGMEAVFDMLSNTTKEAVVIYIEGSIILGIITMFILTMAIRKFEQFSKNLSDKDEVFDKDNSLYLKETAKFLLISLIISYVSSGLLNGAISNKYNFNINTINAVEILFLYMLSFVFSYGHTLEIKKDETVAVKETKPKTTKTRKTKKTEEK